MKEITQQDPEIKELGPRYLYVKLIENAAKTYINIPPLILNKGFESLNPEWVIAEAFIYGSFQRSCSVVNPTTKQQERFRKGETYQMKFNNKLIDLEEILEFAEVSQVWKKVKKEILKRGAENEAIIGEVWDKDKNIVIKQLSFNLADL